MHVIQDFIFGTYIEFGYDKMSRPMVVAARSQVQASLVSPSGYFVTEKPVRSVDNI